MLWLPRRSGSDVSWGTTQEEADVRHVCIRTMKSGFYRFGRKAGVTFRRARWMWESVAGSEDEAIKAEYGVGRDMAAVVCEQTPREPDGEGRGCAESQEAVAECTVRSGQLVEAAYVQQRHQPILRAHCVEVGAVLKVL